MGRPCTVREQRSLAERTNSRLFVELDKQPETGAPPGTFQVRETSRRAPAFFSDRTSISTEQMSAKAFKVSFIQRVIDSRRLARFSNDLETLTLYAR